MRALKVIQGQQDHRVRKAHRSPQTNKVLRACLANRVLKGHKGIRGHKVLRACLVNKGCLEIQALKASKGRKEIRGIQGRDSQWP